jgi:hypothetical protein
LLLHGQFVSPFAALLLLKMVLSGSTDGNLTTSSYVESLCRSLQDKVFRSKLVNETKGSHANASKRTFLVFNLPPRRPSAHSTSTTAAVALR